MAQAAGLSKEMLLREGGFNDDEVEAWKTQTRQELSNAGFSTKEVDEYFGIQEPNLSQVKNTISANLKNWEPSRGSADTADSVLEAIQAGFQMSVAGLVARGKKPDVVLPEDASMFYRIASQMGTLAGDLPAMVAGGIGGAVAAGTAGSVVPIAGTATGAAIGAGAGSFALPEAMRSALIQHYEKGDIKDFRDFWERSSAVFLDTLKAGVVGGATAGVGAGVSKVLAPAAAPVLTKTLAQTSSEIATMVTVGKALEGEVPNAEDFIEAAIVVGGLHTTMAAVSKTRPQIDALASKLRNIYVRTGVKPTEVIEAASKDPIVRQEVIALNQEIPKAFEANIEKKNVTSAATEVIPTPEPGPLPLKPHEEAVGSRIVDPSNIKKDPLSWESMAESLYTKGVDQLNPIKIVQEQLEASKGLSTSSDPYKLARMFSDSGSKISHFFQFGTLNFKTLEKSGKGLDEILKPVVADRAGFERYAVAAKALEYSKKEIETGVPLEEAKLVVQEGKSKYGKVLEELTEFQNRSLEYLKDSGLISEESFKNIIKSAEVHVPFRRLLDEKEASGIVGKKPVKGIKGSEREIISPLVSIVKNVEAYVKLAEQNRAKLALVELIEKSKNGKDFGERVPTQIKKIDIKSEEVTQYLKHQGIEAAPEGFSIFRAQNRPIGKTEIEVFRNGKQEIWNVGPEIAEAYRTLEGSSGTQHLFTRMMAPFASSLRFSLALTPDFIARNLVRDQVTSAAFSKYKSLPFIETFRAIGHITKKDDVFQNWLKSGGGMSSFTEISRNYLEKGDFFQLSKETGLSDRVWNVVKTPIEVLQITAKTIEDATRLAEFKRVSKGARSGENIFEGGFASREVTVDFARKGAQVQALNSISAFLNVTIQGLDRSARAFKENPQGTTARVAALITLPSVLLWFANKDDPRWREIPRWQKDLFWIVMTDDAIYRVPKPQELGILFGSLPERLLEEFFTDNPKALKDFEETIFAAVTPSFMPNAVSPVLEQWANKSFFSGSKIVPAQLEGLLPEYQFTEYTSETAKALGKLIGAMPGAKQAALASPIVLENYIRAWSGNLGMYALQLADKGLIAAGVAPDAIKPVSALADIPFIRAFVVRYPSSTAQSIQDFFDRHEKNKRTIDSIRYLARQGNFEAVQREFEIAEKSQQYVALDGIKEALNNQSRLVQMIYKNPDINPEEKRQQIDTIYHGMIEIAKLGNATFDDLEKGTGR